jgi:signal peptidase
MKMNYKKALLTTTQLLLVSALVVVSLLTFGSKIPFLARLGVNFFYVTSGSMEPTIPTGSLVYSGQYKLEELSEGDIISFNLRSEDSGDITVVTHRVDSINKEETVKGDKPTLNYQIFTKGDGNSAVDANPVSPANIIGVYRWHVPYLGYVTSFAQTVTGFVLLVIVPAVILIIWEIVGLILHYKNYYQQKYAKS